MFNRQNKKSKGASFYIPLSESYYKVDGTPITFDVATTFGDIRDVLKFAEVINSFVTEISKRELKIKATAHQMLYPLIKINAWLLLKTKVIGFRCASLYFLTSSISKSNAEQINDAKFIKMWYHPVTINKAIKERVPPVRDMRIRRVARSLYNHYIYSILVIELINIMDKQRNNSLRKHIGELVKKLNSLNPRIRELYELLKTYPDDFDTIRRLFVSHSSSRRQNNMLGKSDVSFVQKKSLSKSDITQILDRSTFTFDRKMLVKFKTMTHKELKSSLIKVFSKVSVNKDPSIDEFPNMIMTCDVDNPYCEKNKLMIKRNKLTELSDIMASDILNPVKVKYIFNPIFVKNTIDYFRFIIRDNEHITVSI
jgi:hypothetical protein